MATRRWAVLRVRSSPASLPPDLPAGGGALGVEGRVPRHAPARRRLHVDPAPAVHRPPIALADAARVGGLHADVRGRVVHPRRRAGALRGERGRRRGHGRPPASRRRAGIRTTPREAIPGEAQPTRTSALKGHFLAARVDVMGNAIEELANFVARTPWEAIPGAVRAHA